jgi:hypothetical protein
MPQRVLAKQILESNKTAFDGAFSAMVTLQEQAERMTNSFLDQASWLPEEGRKAIRDWIDACKKGRDSYKKVMDDG